MDGSREPYCSNFLACFSKQQFEVTKIFTHDSNWPSPHVRQQKWKPEREMLHMHACSSDVARWTRAPLCMHAMHSRPRRPATCWPSMHNKPTSLIIHSFIPLPASIRPGQTRAWVTTDKNIWSDVHMPMQKPPPRLGWQLTLRCMRTTHAEARTVHAANRTLINRVAT